MITHFCTIKHNPPDSYGDCLRACIASVLDIEDPATVPHFAHAKNNLDEVMIEMRVWLRERKLDVICIPFQSTIEDVFITMASVNPGAYYMVIGAIEDGGHIVVCKNDGVTHNPAWVPTRFDGPLAGGYYIVVLIVPAFMRDK